MKAKSYEVAYICNGKNPKCAKRSGCFYRIENGIRGACSHTRDPKYAIHKRINPKTHPEMFDKVKCGDNVRYYEKFSTLKENEGNDI